MYAEDSSLLPWNTTKTGIDSDAPAFRMVQAEMQAVLKEVQAVLNRVKHESAYARGPDDDVTPLVQAVLGATSAPLDKLPKSGQLKVPPNTPEKPTPSTEVNVHYRVPTGEMDRVLEALDEDSAARAGKATFDYFVASELEAE